MTFIKVNKIDKTFFPNTNRELHALKQVSLEINKGDFITILGGNGAGKSTLLNAIAGTFPLDSGTIVIDNKNITEQAEHKRAAYISRVFQNPLQGTAPRMTVAQNMALALKRGEVRGLGKSMKSEYKEMFKKELAFLDLGLENRLNSEMGLLSGGQRQAISLLMATMKSPDLLLLDEHTAALDPKTQKKIMELTKERVESKGLTAMMITHNISDAIKYGNRIIIMQRGEIVRDINQEQKEKLDVKQLYEFLYEVE